MTIFTILLIGAALLGAIAGSFINALSFRFNTGRRFFSAHGMGGRSRCMHCGHELGGLDLVPLFSFLFLKGACRYCGTRISLQYPLVELAGAALSVSVYLLYAQSIPVFFFWFFTWMVLLFVVIYDIKHTIIPPSCSILLAVLALCALLFDLVGPTFFLVPHLAALTSWALWAGPLLALPLFLLSLISGGAWMGWGDSGLELSLGWFLGVSAGLTALMLAFWIGAIVGLLLVLLSRLLPPVRFFGYTIRSEIPFAPFLAMGALIVFFFHVDFFSTLSALLL